MATREELKQQFADLGVEPSDDVLDKCCEICVLNNIDVEEFVETWMAFSLSHLNGAEPTVETVLQMERKEFAKRDVVTIPKQETTPLRIYNTSLNNSILNEEDEGINQCATPKARTPTSRGFGPPTKSPRSLFSPASYSPDVGTPCSKYKDRQNARQVVLSHGNGVGDINWSSNHIEWTPDIIKLYSDNKNDYQMISNLKNKLMMESIALKADIFNDHIENLAKVIFQSHKLDEPIQFRHPNSEKFITYGRVFSSDNSKLQQNTTHLEASESFSQGLSIELNLQQLIQPNNTCSGLFPGQVIAIEGINPLGDKIIVHRVFSPSPSPLASEPSLKGPLNVVFAAGPFTQSDNLLYQPLEDFVSYIKELKPDLAIIMGPLVDIMHPMIVDGSLAETFEEFYCKVLSGIMDQLSGCPTQVVVVVSARDAAQCPVYPVVPIINKLYPNLITVNDPSLLEINGLVIGVSATDILMHLSREEMPLPSQCGGDRLGRLASHLLSQRNFYPLNPPAEDLAFDASLWENLCNISVTPHILVLPSDLRYFIKNVGDCVVVNPERLAKGQAGGSFARLHIQSSKDINDWKPITHISGQILKI